MWSEQAIAARRFFATPELTIIQKEIDSKIADYFGRGEGYSTTSITFSVFACALLLVYSFEHESWILVTIEIPPGGPQNPNRKRARRRNGYERVIDEALADWIGAIVALVYNIGLQFCREIAAFGMDDQCRGASLATGVGMPAAVTSYADWGISDAPSQSCEDLVQLIPAGISTNLTCVRPLWTLKALGPSRRGRWDSPRLRVPSEEVSG